MINHILITRHRALLAKNTVEAHLQGVTYPTLVVE